MDTNHEHMLAFEVAYYEDPVVAGAGGETYRRPMPPLAPLGTILLPVGCLVRLRQRPQRQYSLPPFSVSAATGRVIRHRQRRFSLPSDSEVGPQIGQFSASVAVGPEVRCRLFWSMRRREVGGPSGR